MNLTQLANLGEFIGGIAVLVTLVYLALQVRQNTSALRASSATLSRRDELSTTSLVLEPRRIPLMASAMT